MISSYLEQILPALLHSIVYGIPVAILGALLALSFHITFGAVKGLPNLGSYLYLHSKAVTFSLVSFFRNLLYIKKIPLEINPHDTGNASPFRVVIIPGTWSPRQYDWSRWQNYFDNLEKCGYAVYKFQWHASNSESARREAVMFLRDWLSKECNGVQQVVLIGHSYGGHVAALAGENPLVSDVITLAAPFVSTSKLGNEQIAAGALALFTRAFLFPTIIWLTYTIYMIYSASGIVGITEPKTGWDAYAFFAGIGSFLFYSGSVVVRLLQSIDKPLMNISLPNPGNNGASVFCVQVKGDPIVEQLVDAARSDFSQAKSSIAFMKQNAIQFPAIKKWAIPYYFLCVIFVAHVYAFPEVSTIFEILDNYKKNITLQALQGCFVFFVYALLIRALVSVFPVSALKDIKNLLSDLSQLVDWDAMTRDNRRSVICLLAGLPLHARLVHSVHICANIPEATILEVELPESRTSWHRHSDVVGNEHVTSKVTDLLCLRIKQTSSI